MTNKIRVIPVINIRRTWRNVTGRRRLQKFSYAWFFGFADRQTKNIFLGLDDLCAATAGEYSFDAFLSELTTTIDHEVAHLMDRDSIRRRGERLANAFENAGRWARKP